MLPVIRAHQAEAAAAAAAAAAGGGDEPGGAVDFSVYKSMTAGTLEGIAVSALHGQTKEELASLTVAQLKGLLKGWELPRLGKKADLVDRLWEKLAASEAAAAAAAAVDTGSPAAAARHAAAAGAGGMEEEGEDHEQGYVQLLGVAALAAPAAGVGVAASVGGSVGLLSGAATACGDMQLQCHPLQPSTVSPFPAPGFGAANQPFSCPTPAAEAAGPAQRQRQHNMPLVAAGGLEQQERQDFAFSRSMSTTPMPWVFPSAGPASALAGGSGGYPVFEASWLGVPVGMGGPQVDVHDQHGPESAGWLAGGSAGGAAVGLAQQQFQQQQFQQ